jgi:predicted DNA binding CopG/RHH family protein
MKKSKLTKEEKEIEASLLQGDYRNVSKTEFRNIALALERRKKDAVLNIRVNSIDLRNIKRKAKKLGIPYQTFISELIHRIAA